MIKGTTTQFRFYIPCDFSAIEYMSITFWQEGYYGPADNRRLPIIKEKAQCTTLNSPRTVCVTLNREETLRFSEDRKAYVQFRATASDGTSYATKKREITVYPVYDDSLIEDVAPTPDFDGYIILDGLSVGGGD